MKDKIKRLTDIILGKEMGVLPGNLAYSFFFAIIPVLSILFYLLTSFNLPADVIQKFLTETFPSSVTDLLQPIFNSSMTLDSLIPMIIGICVATCGCFAINLASNTIYNVENGPLLRRIIKSIFMIMMIIILLAFILVVPLLGSTIINVISSVTPIMSENQTVVDILYFILQVPVSLIIMFYIIKLIYVIAPDSRISGKSVNKGALFTTISWLIVTIVFSYYINNIARYDRVYGNLANIAMLLFYFYILAYVFTLGLFLNKNDNEKAIERTNTIKLEELRKKIQKDQSSK